METKIIETPVDQRKVEIRSWLTGKEVREIRNLYLSRMSFDTGKITGNPAELSDGIENRGIEMVVVSVDGDKNKVTDSILGMKSKDYDFIKKIVNETILGKDFGKPVKEPNVGIDSEN